jgi:hypothetical protein
MKRSLGSTIALAALLLAALLTGCGDKIEIPVPEGDFGIFLYEPNGELDPGFEIRQISFSAAGLHVLGPDRIQRRNIQFAPADSVDGLSDARALYVDPEDFIVFVWEEGLGRVSWYDAVDLTPLGSTDLPEVTTVVAMVTNFAGVEQVPWASTFLYLSDPVQGVVHRYAFDSINGLVSNGILTRADGDAARFVHIPAGMVTDSENRLLICDQDSLRNWVIRFDSTPDTTDVTSDPTDEDPLRGLAVPFGVPVCLNPPAGEFVIGFAPRCESNNDGTWEGRVGDAAGEFNAPSGLAVDGKGRIFVADTGNNRVQVFTPLTGDPRAYELQFGSAGDTPRPTSIGVIDQVVPGDVHFGAFVFVHLAETNRVARFISSEHAAYLEEDKPIELP